MISFGPLLILEATLKFCFPCKNKKWFPSVVYWSLKQLWNFVSQFSPSPPCAMFWSSLRYLWLLHSQKMKQIKRGKWMKSIKTSKGEQWVVLWIVILYANSTNGKHSSQDIIFLEIITLSNATHVLLTTWVYPSR